MKKVSRFHKLDIEERRKIIQKMTNIQDKEFEHLFCPLPIFGVKYGYLNQMTENVIAEFASGLSVVFGMQINRAFRNIPLVTEELTVVAAISRIAKLSRRYGFSAYADEPVLYSHISMKYFKQEQKKAVSHLIMKKLPKIRKIMKKELRNMNSRGGGLRKAFLEETEHFLHLVFKTDVRDAMGANTVTQATNKVAKYLQNSLGIQTLVEIVSNSVPDRCGYAEIKIPVIEMDFKNCDGIEIANLLCEMHQLASEYRRREATHNKGLMNGLSAILTATGQDDRANWAGFSDYVKYEASTPITVFQIVQDNFVAKIKLPIVVGTVGAPLTHHQSRYLLQDLIKIKSAQDLVQICACVALSSILASTTSLVSKDFHDSYDKFENRRK